MRPILLSVFLVFLLVCCRSNGEREQPIPNGTYRVHTVKKDSVTDRELTLIFNVETGQVRGQAPCNIYSATYVVSDGKIKFSDPIITKMSCPEANMLEHRFFKTLAEADRYEIRKRSLKMYSADKVILTAKSE